jgi:hypothetical protein
MGFRCRPAKGGKTFVTTSSDPSFGWAAKPETAIKKLWNRFGFRAQFEEFPGGKHYFRDFFLNRKNLDSLDSVEGETVILVVGKNYVRRAHWFSFSV